MKKYIIRDLGTVLLILSLITGTFFLSEPSLGQAIEDQFIVTQTVT